MSAQDNITFSCEWFMRDWMNKRINETSSTTMQYKNHKCCVYVNDAEYKQEPQMRLYLYFWEWCVQCSAGCVCSTKNHSQRTIYWLDNLVCWCCVFVGAVFFFFSFTRQTHNQIFVEKVKVKAQTFHMYISIALGLLCCVTAAANAAASTFLCIMQTELCFRCLNYNELIVADKIK